jgi:hypothetical protein
MADRNLLGIMYSDEFLNNYWNKDIKISKDEKIESINPGDYLYYDSAIKNIPLLSSANTIKLKLSDSKNTIDYKLYLRNKLSHFTSLINPSHGLTRIKEIWGIDADALIGGNTEVVGWRTLMRPAGQIETIVPGGFSKFIEKGLDNAVNYPEGGQGLIMFPDRKLLYSFATAADGKDMHEALRLYSALKLQNSFDVSKIIQKKNTKIR